ncbi:MAG: hypothetical protein ACJ764_06595 [Solirubrobacteraceae bacterium]
MEEAFERPYNPVLRYLAILSAARDFGVSQADCERVARNFDPLTVDPDDLAGVLVDVLLSPRT